jgi:glycosyltransferase involved in cell wall biosynthesis
MDSKPIKVLRIINRLNLGGPTFNAAYLTKFLAPEFETKLIAGMKDDSEASSEFIVHSLGLEPEYIKDMHRSIHPIKDLKSFFEIRRIIKEFKPTIVHTHAAKSGAIGRLAALSCGVPVILHTFHGHIFHSYFSGFSTKVFLFIERWLAKRTAGIIAISNLQKKELCEDFLICDKDRTFVVPLGFDLAKFTENQEDKRIKFRSVYNIQDDEIVISIVGRLVPIKNHNMFLDSIKYLHENTTQKFRAMIVGDGESRADVEAYCTSLDLRFNNQNIQESNPITFTSWIKEIDEVNAGSDIICLTSLNEGTPVSLIEASAAGKPILSTNVGGIADFIEEGINGMLVESEDGVSYNKALLTLVNDKSLRDKMSGAGREITLKKFSFMRLVEDVRVLYRKLIV